MNEINTRKFLLRMSNGNFIKIKAQNGNIVISKNTRGGKWSAPLLLQNMRPCFYADLDSKDNLHILSQDLMGNVYYFKTVNDKFIKYKILQSATDTAYDRNFFMLLCSDIPIFFYSIHKQDETTIVYQTISKNGAGTPTPISLVPATQNPFWITYLDSKTAIILYPKVSGLYIQICAIKLRLDSLHLSSNVIITREEANCESPKCIVVHDKSINILYSVRKNGRSYLKYQSGKVSSFEFDVSEIIATSSTPFRRYNLEYSDEKININWSENGYIYFREKHLSEQEFTKTKPLKLFRASFIEYYFYKSNTQHEKSRFFSTEQPMSLEGNIRHAFYKEYPSTVKKSEDTEKKKDDRKINPVTQNDSFTKAISGFLSSQAGSDLSKQNSAKKVGDLISLLSQVLSKTDGDASVNSKKKKYKLHQVDGYQKFKAARE